MSQKQSGKYFPRTNRTEHFLLNVLVYLEHSSKKLVLFITILLFLAVSILDFFVTIDISLSVFFLFPILFATWLLGRKWGLFFSFLSTLAWLIADAKAKSYTYFFIPYWNAGVRFSFFIIITYLSYSLQKAYEREKKLARIDVLTGAVNRRFIFEVLQNEIERSLRYKKPITLVYIDVDNFKSVNDSLGHQIGDKLLKLIVTTIEQEIRLNDVIARLGGDEFIVLLPETDYESAKIVLNRVRMKLSETVIRQFSAISFSIGAVTYINPPKSVDKMLEKADSLMYSVKRRGKNALEHIFI